MLLRIRTFLWYKDVHEATRVRLEKYFVVALPEEFANPMTCPHSID